MRILAAQIHIPAISTKEEQVSYIHSLLQRLKEQLYLNSVDLIVLPELSTMEYSIENFQKINIFSEALFGNIHNVFSEFCRSNNVAVCYGLPRIDGDKTYISQVVLNKQGEYLTHYDKVHLAEYGDSSESRFFSRGNHLAVFDIEGIKAGIIICYDMRFPELARRYRKEFNIDVLIHPVAFAQDCSFPSWKQFVVSRALENQIFFLSLNRAGPHFGFSTVCPPWIDDQVNPIVFGESEEFRVIEIDKQVLCRVREEIPFSKDSLSSYGSLGVVGKCDTDVENKILSV